MTTYEATVRALASLEGTYAATLGPGGTSFMDAAMAPLRLWGEQQVRRCPGGIRPHTTMALASVCHPPSPRPGADVHDRNSRDKRKCAWTCALRLAEE
jgi:hypothetical protein